VTVWAPRAFGARGARFLAKSTRRMPALSIWIVNRPA
jgi:hypothetical protein